MDMPGLFHWTFEGWSWFKMQMQGNDIDVRLWPWPYMARYSTEVIDGAKYYHLYQPWPYPYHHPSQHMKPFSCDYNNLENSGHSFSTCAYRVNTPSANHGGVTTCTAMHWILPTFILQGHNCSNLTMFSMKSDCSANLITPALYYDVITRKMLYEQTDPLMDRLTTCKLYSCPDFLCLMWTVERNQNNTHLNNLLQTIK